MALLTNDDNTNADASSRSAVNRPDTSQKDNPPSGTYNDADLLDLWDKIREECIDNRLVFERQWHRNILYTIGRQWITWYQSGGWKDTRTAQWMPKPVTNKCKETVQAIRAMFAAIRLGAIIRPNGSDPANVSAAYTADELTPVLHEEHNMNRVQNEADFWLLVCGNSFFHTYMDYDMKYGVINDPSEQCVGCGAVYQSSELGAQGGVACPDCGGTQFQPAVDELTGSPLLNPKPKGKAVTIALSPLELAFPNSFTSFDDLPYVVRLRWRAKSYYENHPVLKNMVPDIKWSKAPNDVSLQLFRSLSQHNDLGIVPSYLADSYSGTHTQDGIAEYEIWYKPCDAYPDGLVFRVVGEGKGGQIIHLEEQEALPGPLPYEDADGEKMFTFAHAGYEHVGGRIIASGPLDMIIQKQDQLNQLDSTILLTANRMSNPVWFIPKGSEPTKLNGMPGLIVEWNALALGGVAKPERVEGVGPHPSLFQIRQQYLTDIEELAGTFDIMKGAKPSGVEAFSALQLLVERSQSRFASVFIARGEAYKHWVKFALELERQYGPDERTTAILSPARKWTFKNFKRANLQGSVSVVIEDGSNVPKTSLGMRAALDHANQLGMVNMTDPDQQYEGLKLMGLTRMVPTLDIAVQSALQKQEAFEQWAMNKVAQQQSMLKLQASVAQYQSQLQKFPPMMGQAPPPPPSITSVTPLKWLPWYNPIVHRNEFVKWANGDIVRELLAQNPGLEIILTTHLQEIELAVQQQAMQAQGMLPQRPSGGAMQNSNQNSKPVPPEQTAVQVGADHQGPA